ncbi:MAG: AAA family ATPase, partial [Hyphomicrobiales bacterium]|nr:AAA family ATPase [Hyphomicrobiales bacterium]
EGAKLHVLYGRNEAGKSTALSAITDLLFGFEHRIAFDFLHAARDLRIGARIRARSGETLAFRRRRGKGDTLLDMSEKPLGDDALAPFLQGLTRDVFVRAFGLSTATLREGAHEMLRVDGETGATLFAAASGLRRPGELRRALEAEADDIFAPRAKTRRLNEALDRYEAARALFRERELRVGDWKELNARIERLREQLTQVERLRADNIAEQARLQTLKRLAPLVGLLDAASSRLSQSGPVPALPPGFAARLRAVLDAEASAVEKHRDCVRSVQELMHERDRLSIDEPLVARAREITRLLSDKGNYVKAAREDLPRVEGEAVALRADLSALATRLGLADMDEIASRQPSDAELAALRALCREGRALEAELAKLDHDLARERQSEHLLQQDDAARGGPPIDPDPLRERLAAVAPVLRRLEQRPELAPAIEAEAKAIAEAARRLAPSIPDLDKLANLSLPAVETIARFRRDEDALAKALDHARGEAQAAERQCGEIEAAIEKLEASHAVPSREAIGVVRNERDASWKRLRDVLFGAELSPPERAASAAVFERQVAHADRLADAALGDAERVARHGLLTRDLVTAREREAKAARAVAAVELQEREVGDAWRGTWEACGIVPLSAGEMEGWLGAVSSLLDRRAELSARRKRLEALVEDDRKLAPMLRSLANAAGLAGLEEVSSLELAHGLDAKLGKLQASWEHARRQNAKLDALRERIEEIESSKKEVLAASQEWASRWSARLPSFGLRGDAGLDEGEAALTAWEKVPEALTRLAHEEARITGMRRDNAAFEKRAMDLLMALAPDLKEHPVEVATEMLHERAQSAVTLAARRADCEKRLAVSVKSQKSAEAELLAVRSARAALAGEAGLAEDENFVELAARLDERAALEGELSARREELLRAADGLPEDRIRSMLASFDAEAAAKRVTELQVEQKKLEHDAKETFAALDREERGRASLETGTGAELAAQMQHNAEGELIAAAREWAVLKLGALLLGSAIERHREASQDPLLARAGDFFRALTGAAFVGLGSTYGEDDRPVLVGKRQGGESVEIGAMSEGTRDQLFLALRLAYVESYAAKLEPPPFIADDIFVTFDDERTAHGIEALAKIGQGVQCLLFTHHRRTVEIAADRLGADADIIELAGRASMPTVRA